MASFNSAVIARVAAALYDVQLGNQTMEWAEEQVNSVTYGGSVPALVQNLYNVDFAGTKTHAEVAAIIVANVGITNDAGAVTYVAGLLDAGGAGNEGATIVAMLNAFSAITTGTYAAAAAAFNLQITASLAYAQTPGTVDAPVHPESDVVFTLTPTTAAGADVMRLTGNQDVRIDFTNPANQITGLDVDGDGTIEFNGIERSITGVAANFEIVDAYSRNPLNHLDTANNFLGDIYYDGKGFDGDGTNTDGNIFLGGLGVDEAFGGIGNDFLAGGGRAQGRTGVDILRGGRNADFFFAEMSGVTVDATDGGKTLFVDGGNTSDDTSAGTHGSQDSDWLLFEANDDDEPVYILLDEIAGNAANDDTDVLARSGESMDIDDIENFDASGNLYGFLDDVDVEIGGRAADDRDADASAVGYNYAYGTSAQLDVTGSEVGNIIIGGYDNDIIRGMAGNDLLMGGNLNFLNDPNLAGIVNDGRDELYGGDGNDNILFEADRGVIDGGTHTSGDTLWLTENSLGTRTAAEMTTDGVLRFDLLAQNINASAGYGGADFGDTDNVADDTQDQTNYSGAGRVRVWNMESVIATGLGAIDYKAAGANSPELNFSNQQNFFGYAGDLDLRGDEGSNTLYASSGQDVIEGRAGDDNLSGGDGNDDFYFGTSNTAADTGDGVDVIHRQTDADGNNIWDGTYERDFNIGGSSSTGASSLIVDLGSTDLASADVALTSFSIKIAGVAYTVADTAALMAATSASAVAAIVNTAYHAQDAQVSAVAVGNTIVVTDLGGRDISDTVAEGYAVGGVVSNGAFSALATYNPAGTTVTKDRLIYKSYEDRADNEGVDDDAVLGSIISLGIDSYAEDLVINFEDEDGDGAPTTRLAEDQAYAIYFENLTTQDKVVITINGVKYSLQVGVDLDGNIVANEDGATSTNQPQIQENFLGRLNSFINTFMDDDTSAGEIASAVSDSDADGFDDTLTITQVAYNGEETVFMTSPLVDLSNWSGGEVPLYDVVNASEHEVELLDFDGRNAELNQTNVLFWGQVGADATTTAAQEAASRAELSTAKTAGDTLTGTEATVIDVASNNLQDVIYGTTTAIPNNTATNGALWTLEPGWSVHGDDFLLGGAGVDTISGGTGDDRVEGSIGGNGTTTWDVLDGGKNFYAVQVLGEPQARVYVLNKWEAANPSKVTALQTLTISSITLINQNETGLALSNGVFDDTLQFSQRLFTPGVSRFTITLDNFTLTGGVVELRNDGAGTVGVDTDGNGTIDNWTKFTNFENVRTVSGTSNAVAGDGQGNDTLNVSAMSSATTGANGIMYNLTNNGAAGDLVGDLPGSVMYSTNAHANLLRPVPGDFESLVLRVDGVENVIGGTGDDLLLIDETEAAKNNTFTGDLGDDRIEYRNNYNVDTTLDLNNDAVSNATDDDIASDRAEPTVKIKIDGTAASLGGTDTVTMTGGRVGSTVAVDTLNGVELIALTNNTAQGSREDDLLDVTALTAGAIVNYADAALAPATSLGAAYGSVRALDGTLHLVIENIQEIENIWADGNDTVLVADSAVMGTNDREDAGDDLTPAANIVLPTFLDYDTLKNPGTDNTRLAFSSQDSRRDGAPGVATGTDPRTTDDIEVVLNQNQFTFNLSKTGSGADSDTVDYSNATDAISVVVELDATKPNQYVMVDADGGTFDGVDAHFAADDRIDQLVSVERIVASQGESVLDLSGSTKGLEIKWSAFDAANQVASLDRDVYSVRISDLSTASPLQRTFAEYRDAGLSATTTQNKATWSRVEGSDNAEVLILNSAHSQDNNTFNLRGGANQVKYNELTRSITTTLRVQDYAASDALGVVADVFAGPLYANTNTAADSQLKGTVQAITQFQDGNGAALAGGGTHVVTSYTANNGIATGSLRIAASQDAEDTLAIAGNLTKVFLLSEAGTTDNQITVKLGSGAAQNSVILTGYELLSDASSNDVYDMGTLQTTLIGLTLTDAGGDDHDTLKVGNDAVAFNTGVANQIDLDWISSAADGADADAFTGFNFDFDVLDITKVTASNLNLVGGDTGGAPNPDAEGTDEVVLGALSKVISLTGFAAVVLTNDSASAGSSFTFNPAAGTLVQGSTTVTTGAAAVLSAGGLTQEGTLRNGSVADVTTGLTLTVAGATAATVHGGAGGDTITGAGGADTLRGNGGADTLDGGTAAEVRTVQLDGISAVGGAVTLTFDADGGGAGTYAVAVTAGVEYVIGAGSDAIGAALATKITANLAALNAAVSAADAAWNDGASLISANFNSSTDLLTFTFSTGVNVTGTITTAETEGGTFAISTETVVTEGSDGGIDTFVFEPTATANGADTINNFVAANGASDDLLDFTAFLGAAATSAGPADFVAAGLDLTGAANVGVVFNKASLAAGDIAVAAAAGKVAVENDGKAVVLVTADADGAADATVNAYLVYYVQDTDTTAAQSYSVTLVGTLNSTTELVAANFTAGTDAFV